jgi:hypothetical protein
VVDIAARQGLCCDGGRRATLFPPAVHPQPALAFRLAGAEVNVLRKRAEISKVKTSNITGVLCPEPALANPLSNKSFKRSSLGNGAPKKDAFPMFVPSLSW